MDEAGKALEESLEWAKGLADGSIYVPPTPIQKLMKEYEEECCNFSNIRWVCKTGLIFSGRMPDSYERALIYQLSIRVVKYTGYYDELKDYSYAFQGKKNTILEDFLRSYPDLLKTDDEDIFVQGFIHVDSGSEDCQSRCIIYALSEELQRINQYV